MSLKAVLRNEQGASSGVGSFGLESMDVTTRRRVQHRYAGTLIGWVARGALAIGSLFSSSCAIDGADACGAHQIYKSGGTVAQFAVCVCDTANGYVFDKTRGYGCKRCPAGKVGTDDGQCVVPVSDAGMSDAGMSDASSDASSEADSASKPEPTGVGQPCQSAADCSNYDATYCETQQLHACLVQNCATDASRCGSRTTCCDYTVLSLCLPDDELADGTCPMGGKKVVP